MVLGKERESSSEFSLEVFNSEEDSPRGFAFCFCFNEAGIDGGNELLSSSVICPSIGWTGEPSSGWFLKRSLSPRNVSSATDAFLRTMEVGGRTLGFSNSVLVKDGTLEVSTGGRGTVVVAGSIFWNEWRGS